MASYNSERGQYRYRKGQKYHEAIHAHLRKCDWVFLDEATPEEDMNGIDYWWEMSQRTCRYWPEPRWKITGVDYKVMFGDRLGVQTRMKESETDGYLFGRVFPKLKKIEVHYIRKKDFWNHPRLRKDVNKDGEEYAYIHRKYTGTRSFYFLGVTKVE